MKQKIKELFQGQEEIDLWIVTAEVNAYDQEGEYFVTGFIGKPTIEDLTKVGFVEEYAKYLLETGGGRQNAEDTWYYLRKLKPGEQISNNPNHVF